MDIVNCAENLFNIRFSHYILLRETSNALFYTYLFPLLNLDLLLNVNQNCLCSFHQTFIISALSNYFNRLIENLSLNFEKSI